MNIHANNSHEGIPTATAHARRLRPSPSVTWAFPLCLCPPSTVRPTRRQTHVAAIRYGDIAEHSSRPADRQTPREDTRDTHRHSCCSTPTTEQQARKRERERERE
ncbi:hypothetical protein BDFG_09432, partial [Blastomyces dermatitidis ATCC 26199]